MVHKNAEHLPARGLYNTLTFVARISSICITVVFVGTKITVKSYL